MMKLALFLLAALASILSIPFLALTAVEMAMNSKSLTLSSNVLVILKCSLRELVIAFSVV